MSNSAWPRSLKVLVLVLALWAMALSVYLAVVRPWQAPGTGLKPVPEAERHFKNVVIGLAADTGRYYYLPTLPAAAPSVAEQLYWLDLERSHGRVLDGLPLEAELYVAYPLPGDKDKGQGQEPDYFRRYLRQRLAWDEGRIARIHFFAVNEALVWPQDAGLGLGYDRRGRLVLASGPVDVPFYQVFVRTLVKAYPRRFALKVLPEGISAEGGDMAVVRRTDGSVGLVLGRHRILNWLQSRGEGTYVHAKVPPEALARAMQAYEAAYGLPVMVLPQAALLEGWGEEELFHLDMVAGFLSGPGQALALVPRLSAAAVDHLTRWPLDPTFRQRINREFNAVASQLESAGFGVLRPVLADHPVRSPANCVKGVDGQGRPVLILPRQPAWDPDLGAPLTRYHTALANLMGVTGSMSAAADGSEPIFQQALAQLWGAMDLCRNSPTAEFDAQAALFGGSEWSATPAADFPWGAGSFHCQLLH